MTTPSDPDQSAFDSDRPDPRSRRRRLPLLAAGAVVLVVAAAVVVYLETRPTLENRDPAGAKACTMLADWQRGDVHEKQAVVRASLGDQAIKSVTDSIRDAAGANVMDGPDLALLRAESGVTSLRLADLRRLHAACEGEGVDMPRYVEPAD